MKEVSQLKILEPVAVLGNKIVSLDKVTLYDIVKLEYREVRIPKSTSGYRTLHIPSDELKEQQRIVLRNMLYRLEVSPSAHCAVPGRSVITNAKAHYGSKSFYKVDFKDAFPSTSLKMVESSLIRFLDEDLGAVDSEEAGKEIAWMSVWKNGLPQGAPTSPYLLNLVCRPLDKELIAFARENLGVHTRYADDCCLSSRKGEIPEDVREEYRRIITRFGYRINSKKTSYNRGGSVDPVITGVTISRRSGDPFRIGLSKKEINRHRAIITNAISDESISDDVVFGIISWVLSVYRRIPSRLVKPFQAFLETRTPELLPRYKKYFLEYRPSFSF